ncbi:AMP-binding protein [Maritimibacter dapengensis]|uniref:Long-chain-fatty-acid--CoA ligase n=1 Tax=Maritimibacter dapengensis TaxID=2836868 RepID=A0ABS6T1R7_9RHOB|nr:AMP-binding protein [Maritimibacter dapengensis]MBV7379179.1 AMP-binding protein [Maritimibacter dapengensis]
MIEADRHPWLVHYPERTPHDLRPEPSTWCRELSKAFAEFEDQLMLEYYGQTWTYAEMRQDVARMAAALRASGIGKGDRIALHLPNCPWHPIFFYAALATGAAVTHLSPLDAAEEIAHKLEDSGAKLVVTLKTPELCHQFNALIGREGLPVIVQCSDPVSAAGRDCPLLEGAQAVEDFWDGHEGARFDPVDVRPDDIALLQYTGGTTGLPKAAVLTHANLCASVEMFHAFSLDEPAADRGKPALVYSPLFHIMGLVTALMKRTREGGVIHLRLRFDAAQAVEEIARHKIASFGGVPTTWIGILQAPGVTREKLASLEYASSGGAPMPTEVRRRVREMTGLDVRGGWGMTETSAAGTLIPKGAWDDKAASIGVPIAGAELKIVDVEDPAKTLPTGETGEIAIRGPNVMREYWNKPEETRTAFHDGWLLTGDVGYMDDDGFFYIVDRKKDLILSGGFNVYPLVIEKAVHQHPNVAEAMVVGVPDDYRGESAKVYVTLNVGAKPFSLTELQAFLADKLGRHEIPRHLEFRATLPHTPVGKADRKALRRETRDT